MDLVFANNKLRRQMSSEREMQRAFGERARKLQLRLGVLKNAASLADVPRDPPTRCHELTGDWAGCFAVMIAGNWRLVFEPGHNPTPTTADGGVDLSSVTAVRVLEVVDYH